MDFCVKAKTSCKAFCDRTRETKLGRAGGGTQWHCGGEGGLAQKLRKSARSCSLRSMQFFMLRVDMKA